MKIINNLTTNHNDLEHIKEINALLNKNKQQFVLISAPNQMNNITFYTLQPCKLAQNNQSELLINSVGVVVYVELDTYLSNFKLSNDQLMSFINRYCENFYTTVNTTKIDFKSDFIHLGSIEQSKFNGPHIIKYTTFKCLEDPILLIPTSSIFFWDCLLSVYYQILISTIENPKEYDFMMLLMRDFIDGLSQYYTISTELEFFSDENNPVTYYRRAFWQSHNSKLANIANSLNNSIN